MSSPILRGGDLVVTEAGIRESVRQAVLPLWNAWYFLSLYARGRRPRWARWRTDSTDVLDRYILAKTAELRDGLTAALDALDIAGACARGALVPGGADQLVRPAVPPAVLGRRRRRDRHPAHRAGGGLPAGGAAAAADHRGGLAGADRRAVGAPGRLAGGRACCRPTPTWWRRWTRSARSRRWRCRSARASRCGSGSRWPRSTVVASDVGPAGALPRSGQGRDQRPRRRSRRPRRRRRAPGPPAADGQRPRRRPAAGQAGAAGDQGGQGRRVGGRRVGRRDRAAASTWWRGSTPSSWSPPVGADAGAHRGDRHPAVAAASSCSTPRWTTTCAARGSSGTWSGWCSRPARTPGSTSATGSR